MAKIPGKFKKPISKKTFEKKFLKYIFIKEQKEFVKNKFGIKDEMVVLKESLNKKEAKQLKIIAKTAKKNRGLLRTGKITVLVIIFAGLILFYTVFMSPLLQKSAEKLFSGIFEAKVEFSRFKFNPLAGRVSFDGLTVADKENEFRNLFELGPSVLDLEMEALLRKKFVIEKFSASEFAAGTERTTSGFLEKQETDTETLQQEEEEEKSGSSSFDNFLSALQLDTKAIIEKESDNLVSLKAAEELPAVYQKKADEYAALYDQTLDDYESISKTVNEVSAIDVKNLKIKDIPRILTLVQEIDDDIKAANKLLNEYTLKIKQIDGDIKAAAKDISNLKSGIDQDINYLMSFFDFSSGNAERIGSDLINTQLSRYLGSLYTAIKKGLYYSDRVSLSQGAKKEEAEEKKDKGVRIYFPSQKYPSFWLKETSFDMKNGSFGVKITDISSDPVLSNTATGFETFFVTSGLNLDASGFLDLRPDAETSFSLDVNTSGYNLNLNGQLDALELATFTSAMSVSGKTRIDKEGNFSGTLNMVLSAIRAKASENSSMLGSILESVLGKARNIRITAEFKIPVNQALSVSIDTNLNDLLAIAFSDIIDNISQNAKAKIKSYIDDYAGPYISQAEEYIGDIGEILGKYNTGLSGLDSYRKIFNDKMKALEDQKKKLEGSAGSIIKGLF